MSKSSLLISLNIKYDGTFFSRIMQGRVPVHIIKKGKKPAFSPIQDKNLLVNMVKLINIKRTIPCWHTFTSSNASTVGTYRVRMIN
jgi:hypothetical protein